MNIKKIAERQLESIIKAMGDVVKNAEYKELVSNEPENYQPNPVYRTYPIRCIVTDYAKHELLFAGGQIQVSDKKVLIPLKGIAPIIRTKNFLIIDDIEYRIQDVETDPTATSYTCQARKM